MAANARERTSGTGQPRSSSPELNEMRNGSLGGLVDALFGDGPLDEAQGLNPTPDTNKMDYAATQYKHDGLPYSKEVQT